MNRSGRRLRAAALRLRDRGRAVGVELPESSALEPAVGLPEPYASARIWLKRDDALGPGGTKVRKLAEALPRARAAGAQRILTFGHLDSNHALATAAAAVRAGLTPELWIQVAPNEGGLVRREALGLAAPRVEYRSSGAAMIGGALWSARRGRSFLLPPGGTTPETSAAVALAVLEICDGFAALGEPVPDRWAVAVGSGGTLAGLWAGVRALGLSCRPVGFQASDPTLVRAPLVAYLANAALDRLGVGGRVDPAEIELDASQLGAGHGRETRASRAALSDFALAGVPLDPIFTAKAAAGLRAAIERGGPGQCWLFWHTGISVGP